MYELNGNGTSAEIILYDEIGYMGITGRDIVQKLGSRQYETLTIRINSHGGDVFEALAMYNYLKGYSAVKTVYVDGLCASAASVIAMSGDRIIMPSNALMLIHNPWGYIEGTSDDMRDMAATLDKIRDSVVQVYVNKTGLLADEVISLMKAETWMNGDEALSKGFVDEVTGEVKNSVRDAYESGVKAERERLKALDDLMCAGRYALLTKAKYETFRNASEIAIELLKNEKRDSHGIYGRYKMDAQDLSDISVKAPVSGPRNEIEAGVKIMNRMRGYEDVR